MALAYPRFVGDLERIPQRGLRGQYGPYIADPGLVHAANTALGLGMPLLLTGEPGCGKSDFAWVAAQALGHKQPLRCHVRSDTRARDLLYHYDALVRFGDAQHGDDRKKRRAEDPRNYIGLRPLGAALMIPGARQVVLVDEIDKAPRDLPNDLLIELDEGRFEIAEIGDHDCSAPVVDRVHKSVALRREMQRPRNSPKPLVVITSNAERQLPEPFLRRCVFFHIPPQPRARLEEIATKRFADQSPEVMKSLTRIFAALRQHGKDMHFSKLPTTSEMIDWMGATMRLYEPDDVQDALDAFEDALDLGNERLSTEAGALTWAELPGASCLLKLKEDLEGVGLRAASAR